MDNQEKTELIQLLIFTAHQFRLAREAEGLDHFKLCIDEIEKKQFYMMKEEFEILQYSMLTAMERHDWLSLADDIEYELPMLIK